MNFAERVSELEMLIKEATPGPWVQSSTVLVCNKDARIIANCVPLSDIPALSIPIRQVDYNARLIAAAPEAIATLLQAVKELQGALHRVLMVSGRLSRSGPVPLLDEMIQVEASARAALDKWRTEG